MDPKHHLEHTLTHHRFKNDQHRTTLILGAGLHHHLKAHATATNPSAEETERWAAFTDWSALLRKVAGRIEQEWGGKLNADALESLRKPFSGGADPVDPAARWEALVLAALQTNPPKVGSVEKKCLKLAADSLKNHPAPNDRLTKVAEGLRNYRDVIDLNFDMLTQRALKAKRHNPPTAKLQTPQKSAAAAAIAPGATHTVWREGELHGRVWTPHGSIRAPSDIVLGVWRYGGRIEGINTARKNAKASEHKHTPKINHNASKADHAAYLEKRRGDAQARGNTPIHWLDAILSSPVVIVGASMDRAEADLWYALHTRARNLARLPERDCKAPVFYLWCTTTGLSPHLRDRPAGIIPVEFSTWDDAWDTLGLGLKR